MDKTMAKSRSTDENITILSDELETVLKYNNVKIPNFIKENLSKELREYQIKALQHYLLQRQSPSTNHLMFNMATGSGKTLIMASLILDCYKRGYRNFVFFVSSTAILEKTKSNFCDKSSSKYLFNKDINIENKRVEINTISNLSDSKEYDINIYFSTIQGLFSLFTNERENSLTLQDLKGKKLVFLADEAHHLNADTKKQKADDEKSGWEGVIKKAFISCDENLLFEFSATLPKTSEVLNKYKNKIVYKYDLQKFCFEGYSKRIFLVKYENSELKDRFLGAMVMSTYRQILASKNDIFLKPVILFKSEKINDSKDNEKIFLDTLENLNSDEIEKFYENANSNELFRYSYDFFNKEFGSSFATTLITLFKISFKNHIININDEKEKERNQILLNTLEEKDNEVRVIFAVDKLNEGWDVLNLFDIVRLSKKNSDAVTTQEAQLIGRGARYFPFVNKDFKEDIKFKRKYDDNVLSELSMLERLTYHSVNDVDFISNLNKSMKESGLFLEEDKRVVLKPSKKATQVTKEYKIFYVSNERIKVKNLFKFDDVTKVKEKADKLKDKLSLIDIPLFSNKVLNAEVFVDNTSDNADTTATKFGDQICYNVFLKALNQTKINFCHIKKNFGVSSKQEFYNEISQIRLNFSKKQQFDRNNQLEITKFLLSNLKNIVIDDLDKFEATEFKIKELTELGERVILRQKDKMYDSKYEWLYYDKYSLDSKLENDFLNYIDDNKDKINSSFNEWIVFRNDGFKEFKIYDNREQSKTYSYGFEPDFVFFGIKKESQANNDILKIECFLEVKGEHIKDYDSWKEDLLLNELDNKQFDKLQVVSFPFFTKKDNKNFSDKFEAFLND
ncbi:DEAD/DEAH box helicase family protein [Campylobacter fetus]|uniref:DEAD/DEAH box helicase family protein n=1 Tax=Campylobacter fetus TaxID=196 RepID=UPI001F304EC3|nr:DEAD/DEAH box helicase family protein [Campylobacter fetus]